MSPSTYENINQHLQSQKHKEAEKAMTSAGSISSYFVTNSDDTESRKVAATEAATAHLGVRHGQRFRANECLSKLIKTIVEPKFSSELNSIIWCWATTRWYLVIVHPF